MIIHVYRYIATSFDEYHVCTVISETESEDEDEEDSDDDTMSLSIAKKVDLGPQGKKFKKMRPLPTPQFVKNIGLRIIITLHLYLSTI